MRSQSAQISGRRLPVSLHLFAYLFPIVCFTAGAGTVPAWAATAATTTTLSLTSGGNTVTTVTSGNVVTLTATVMAGSTPVTPGQVNFCDATAKFCTDIHLLGTEQLTANGTATLKFRPGVGSHSYKAVLADLAALGPSASTASSLTVTASQGTGQLATTTYFEAGGVPNIFSLTATVPGNGNTLPTGMVSFVDASNGNAVLGTAALTSEAGVGFVDSSLPPVASQNSGNTVLTADFNGDGIPDLVILGSGISVLLGNGDGTFTAAPSLSGGSPGAIAVGDFNGDGIPDLAVVPSFDESESAVFLGNGDGTFTQVGGILGTIGGNSFTSNAMAAADFNGDGKPDLAVVCAMNGDSPCSMLLILTGNGDGTFMQGSSIPFATFGSQSAIVVGDFNGDGQPDLAVTNSGANGVNVFLNHGGNLTAVSAIPATGTSPSSIAAADFNGDGKLDLAVANSGSNNVTILLGNGDGTFTAAASTATGTAPNSIAVADFNGDSVPDLAVANVGSSNVTILLGNGDGTFTAAASPAADTGSTSVSVADFNGDGKEDLVVANSADSSATSLLAETALTIATVNNISPVGVGTHLVKAIYSGDVNYGGSTSVDVSLTVVPPGLTLSATPVSVVAGATGTSTLTITPTNGFSGTVALELECGGANDLPTCSSIPPVTISGSAPVTMAFSIQTQSGTPPGKYRELVYAVDSIGSVVANTNTAIIAVTVTAPAPPAGLTLSGTPVSVVAGATGTSTLTITPTNGFSGTVTLKCNGGNSPGGANDVPACSSIPPVTISGDAPTTTTFSIQTQPGTTPGQYMEHVDAVDSSGVAMANTTVAVTVTAPAPSFALTNTTISIATPGASGTSMITISPSGGFTGSVALSCTVTGPTTAVDQPTCSVAAPPAITGTAAVTATLTVNTTAASSSSNATGQAGSAFPNRHNGMLALGGGGTLAAFLFFGVPSRRYRTKTLLSLLLLGAFATTVMGCGGARKAANPVPTPTDPGTTVGSYMVTVTGSGGNMTATTVVTVMVN
ncbi:FG-GAP-like repeat-containing protein [Acidicapsa acidisoli]|uniref:FG-GAP-like repeat-containing protein n=1 Tax=Acidicapsa acidisoli TaxID=1615681 RepID=UPI0021DF4B52|nr:FG-GAP-like repeat-containing protein [Acidicapsa acidisoli]